MRMIAASARMFAMVSLVACGPPRAVRPLPPELPTAPAADAEAKAEDEDEDEEPARRHIRPGVLRALMVSGELSVRPVDALAAAIGDRDAPELLTRVRVCLDEQGTATSEVTASSAVAALDRVALTVAAGWRFEPYRDGGVPMPACSVAVFRYGPPPPQFPYPEIWNDALPAAELELPLAVKVDLEMPPDHTTRPPTPGVALAWVCRRPGLLAAPRLAWLQSSGDPTVDRELSERHATMPIAEATEPGQVCFMWVAIAAPRPRVAAVPRPPREATGVPPQALEARRIAGEKIIYPSDRIRTIIQMNGSKPFIVPVKVCVDVRGRVSDVAILKSSGFAGYDADLINAIATWHYRPFTIDGMPAPACGMVNFSYRQT